MPQIDFDVVMSPALNCVNRACMFMGFGMNAARDPKFRNYNLPDLQYFQIVPAEMPDEKLSEYKDEFGVWVVANGLRELVDSWELVLDGLNSVTLQADFWHASKLSIPDSNQYTKRNSKFSLLPTSDKLDILEKNFGIHLPFRSELESLKKARNCLVHRFGYVAEKDLNSGDFLQVTWRVPEIFGRHKDGSEFVPNIEGPYPIAFPVDSPVMFRSGQREKRMRLGERIRFEPKEIKEICYTYLIAVQQAREACVKYIEGIGGVVNCKDPSNREAS